MGVRTQETRIIKAIHGHLHRTDSSTLIIIRLDHEGNRLIDRILMDTRIKANMVRDKIFGDRMAMPHLIDSHDLLS